MISFERPPVAEVSVGVVFVPRADLLIPHIGDFWGAIRAQYPHTEHAQLVLGDGDEPVQDRFGNWLPRVWFISENRSLLVQVQQDRFCVNWRATSAAPEYPRFATVKREFDRVWAIFQQHVTELTDSPPSAKRVEVSYVNFIIGGDVAATSQLSNVLREFRWGAHLKHLPPPANLSLNLAFPLRGGNGSLRVRATTAQRMVDKTKGIHLELDVVSHIEESRSVDELLEEAHLTIIHAFTDLTTSEMHGLWGEEVSNDDTL